jgi:arabinan endo-1,5-alpha-L-arabinosidase
MQWETLFDGLPILPQWAVQEFGWTWAPDVAVPANGKGYVMYYTTRFAMSKGGAQCIGVATADSPEGPFKPNGDKPLICPTGDGGAIDAASFIDEDGKPYLLWKNDGNSMGGISWIWIQPVSEDGLSLAGPATRLIKADQVWEGVLIEGPTLWKHEGKYYLFYSANDYASPRYAAGYAVADSILGPYTKGTKPVLQSVIKAGVVGPGGQDITTDAQGHTWILFHGWDAVGQRDLYLARLDWQDGVPVVTGLSRDPQPGPGMGH